MWSFYRGIWRHTANRQLILLFLSVIVAALAAVPLDYQKQIINGLTQKHELEELVQLVSEMFMVILASLGIKWLLNYKAGITGEWAIKQLRNKACESFENVRSDSERGRGKGTLANIISSETETVGTFVGTAISTPILELGTLVSIIGYIAFTQPRLGLVLFCVLVPQVIILTLTQFRINKLVAERVLILRRSINQISEEEIVEVKNSVFQEFDRIYETRRKIFIWKLSTKFVLSAINGLGLIAVLAIGGWLVLEERSTVGTVVAATVGLGRIEQPWRQLTAFYRNLNVINIQYQLMKSYFAEIQSEGLK